MGVRPVFQIYLGSKTHKYEHQWGMVHFILNDKSFIGRGYVIVNLVH